MSSAQLAQQFLSSQCRQKGEWWREGAGGRGLLIHSFAQSAIHSFPWLCFLSMINEYVVPALKTAAALNCWQSESNTRARQGKRWQVSKWQSVSAMQTMQWPLTHVPMSPCPYVPMPDSDEKSIALPNKLQQELQLVSSESWVSFRLSFTLAAHFLLCCLKVKVCFTPRLKAIFIIILNCSFSCYRLEA